MELPCAVMLQACHGSRNELYTEKAFFYQVQQELEKNGNGQAVFTIDRITVFEAKIAQAWEWTASAQNLPNPLPEILMLMKANPRITYVELAVQLSMSQESMRKHIKSLKERHKLITRQGGTRGFWVTHSNPGE